MCGPIAYIIVNKADLLGNIGCKLLIISILKIFDNLDVN
jgi:hypothetical protein